MTTDTQQTVASLFAAGAHYAYPKSRRHPTAQRYIFGAKSGVEIFNLEKTAEALEAAVAAVEKVASLGKKVLFVGGKREAQKTIADNATAVGAPFVAGRWVGGTLSNFGIIRKRVEKLLSRTEEREQGTLVKYTKKERLLIDREIKRLEEMFGGVKTLTQLPGMLVIIDPKHERSALAEARMLNIPVVALANSDCNTSGIAYPIPANDANLATITYIVGRLAEAFRIGAAEAPKKPVAPDKKSFTREGATTSGRRLPRAPRSAERT